MRKLLATKEFKSELVREYSWSPHPYPVGMADNVMELWVGDDGTGCIIWNWEVEDGSDYDEEVIGLWWNFDKTITDFDGVFEIPDQAIDLLKENGFNTEEVES